MVSSAADRVIFATVRKSFFAYFFGFAVTCLQHGCSTSCKPKLTRRSRISEAASKGRFHRIDRLSMLSNGHGRLERT